MNDQGYSKVSCQHCGENIEFPAAAAGQDVPCPHCGWQTFLGESANEAPKAASGTSDRAGSGKTLGLSLLLGVLITGGLAYYFVWGPGRSDSEAGEKPMVPVVTKDPVMAALEAKGLKVTDVRLETTGGTTLVYAVGQVTNLSEEQRFGLKVQVDLFDKDDNPVGKASDYKDVLEPKAQWDFKALVLAKKVDHVKVAGIEENQ